MSEKIKYCSNCLGNGYKSNKCMNMTLTIYVVCDGIYDVNWLKDKEHCQQCGKQLIPLHITTEEWEIIQKISTDSDFVFALDKLKSEDIIEYNMKLSQMKQTVEAEKQTELIKNQNRPKSTNIPKCPTCGSTNIKKISAGTRYVSTGLFGLGSSNVGKTMCCNNCGYKW